MRTLVTVSVITLLSSICAANGQEFGRVTTSEGEPVIGLPIIITEVGNPDNGFVSMTGKSGELIANDLAPGVYQAVPINGLSEPAEFTITAEEENCVLFKTVCSDGDSSPVAVIDITVPQNWSISGN